MVGIEEKKDREMSCEILVSDQRNGCHTHELIAAMFTCMRSAQEQANKRFHLGEEGLLILQSLAEELMEVGGC